MLWLVVHGCTSRFILLCTYVYFSLFHCLPLALSEEKIRNIKIFFSIACHPRICTFPIFCPNSAFHIVALSHFWIILIAMPNTSKKQSKSQPKLPKPIRDELCMTVALRCYSVLREGKGKKLSDIYNSMSEWFHGNEPAIPSHLKLLCNASFCFKEIYDSVIETTTSKSNNINKENVTKHILKEKLVWDKNTYVAGVDIIPIDLKKKTLRSRATGNSQKRCC